MKLEQLLNEINLNPKSKQILRDEIKKSPFVHKLTTLYIDTVLDIVDRFDFNKEGIYSKDARQSAINFVIDVINSKLQAREKMLKK